MHLFLVLLTCNLSEPLLSPCSLVALLKCGWSVTPSQPPSVRTRTYVLTGLLTGIWLLQHGLYCVLQNYNNRLEYHRLSQRSHIITLSTEFYSFLNESSEGSMQILLAGLKTSNLVQG